MFRLLMFAAAMTLSILGTLVFMAGHQMDLLSPDTTRLVGTGCFMFSAVPWCLWALTFERRGTEETRKSK